MIAGISHAEARHLFPGWVLDMYKIRADYDFRMAWGASPNKVAKAMGMGKTGKKKG